MLWIVHKPHLVQASKRSCKERRSTSHHSLCLMLCVFDETKLFIETPDPFKVTMTATLHEALPIYSFQVHKTFQAS